jgi:hypothetical protein
MNEKVFHNGSKQEKINLVSIIGATNELPVNNVELEAIYDRFLTRTFVDYVSEENSVELLNSATIDFKGVSEENKFTISELKDFRKELKEVKIPKDILNSIAEIKREVSSKFGLLSDRRVVKALNILKASALSNGRKEVESIEISLLIDMFWHDSKDREGVEKIVLSKLTYSKKDISNEVKELYRIKDALNVTENRANKLNEKWLPLYLDRDRNDTIEKESDYIDEETVHLQDPNREYLYSSDKVEFHYSPEKKDEMRVNHNTYKLVFTLDKSNNLIPAKTESGNFIYFYSYNIQTDRVSQADYPRHSSYKWVTHKVPTPIKVINTPQTVRLKDILRSLELFSEKTKERLEELKSLEKSIERNSKLISNSLDSHLWIDSKKLSYLKDFVEEDLRELRESVKEFALLSDTVELYYDKAKDDELLFETELEKSLNDSE